jgi:hypothetical protein
VDDVEEGCSTSLLSILDGGESAEDSLYILEEEERLAMATMRRVEERIDALEAEALYVVDATCWMRCWMLRVVFVVLVVLVVFGVFVVFVVLVVVLVVLVVLVALVALVA